MSINTLNLFSRAAEEVFTEIGFSGLNIESCNNNEQKYDLVASIGITGFYSGFLVIRSDLISSITFINKMLSNIGMSTEGSEFNQSYKEAFGEILNQISGRAAMMLESAGIACDISPPTILKGRSISIGSYNTTEILQKNITGSFGSFNLLVGIQN